MIKELDAISDSQGCDVVYRARSNEGGDETV